MSEAKSGRAGAPLPPVASRRRALTVLVATPAVLAGCGMVDAGELPEDNQDPDHDGGAQGDGDAPTDTGGGETGPACGSGVLVGAVGAFTVGQWKKVNVGTGRFNVGRDAKGLFAYSNTCTHNNSCQLNNPNATSGAMTCPCHGAAFDGNGKVTRGPATRALANYKVTVCDGHVYVDKSVTVAAGTRTPAA